MKRRFSNLMAGLAAATSLVSMPLSAAGPTSAEIQNDAATPGDVLSYGMGPWQQRFSTLDKLNSQNVAKLVPAFASSLGGEKQRGQESQPIVYDGTIYVTGSYSRLFAFDARTGEIKAMGNYPTYDPSNLKDISDLSALSNPIVSSPLEVGSIMKPLTAAAALNEGVIKKDTTYYDPARIVIGDRVVTNVEEDGGPGTKSIGDFLRLSLNTGAVYLLQQLGGGEINEKGRRLWHEYMTNHYGFGSATGVEQMSEAKGTVPDPDNGYGLNITYANTSFGQGMTATLVQMAAAYASIVNGGEYVKPHVVEATTRSDGTKTTVDRTVVRTVVSQKASQDARSLLEYVFTENHRIYGMPNLPDGYSIGGKTGTAQIAKPEGGYYTDRFTGTFAGFVGGDTPEYIIVVRVNEPKIGGFAGAQATAPVFSNLATMMIQNYGVKPKQ